MKKIWCLFRISRVDYDQVDELVAWWSQKPNALQLARAAKKSVDRFEDIVEGLEIRIGDHEYTLSQRQESA